MFGSNALEIATGIVFVYLLLSLLCTVINEGIANLLEMRGKNLLEGIKNLLNDPEFTSLAQHVYNHGLIGGVTQGVTDFRQKNRLPSYIDPTNFALALIDILGSNGAGQVVVEKRQKELEEARQKSETVPDDQTLKKAVVDAQIALEDAIKSAADVRSKYDLAGEAAKKVKSLNDFGKIKEASDTLEEALAAGRALASKYPDPLAALEKGIEALPSGYTKQSLLSLLDKTKREMALVSGEIRTGEAAVEKLRGNLEDWFNDGMDRFAGWYKRWTRQVSFVVAIVLVIFANADSLMLANRLARDGALRAAIATAALGQRLGDERANLARPDVQCGQHVSHLRPSPPARIALAARVRWTTGVATGRRRGRGRRHNRDLPAVPSSSALSSPLQPRIP